ncbi:glycerophosphodiester phosphodiesterase family protein [Microbacterium sp. NPDC055910]|uniref:glycerophosphodiester phosphodiesterase family protein n=1 Tax=Microbacterium sp. NPDC055910 TaxID=3345659 RepID=UPI0035DCE581
MTASRHPFLAGVRPRVLAHRGLVTPESAALGVAENSFAAVAAAHAAGVDIVESDCHVTRDGVVVLFHDDDLLRVTGDPRKIADVTSIELETIMSERGGLVTLAQALDAFPTVRFNLDVKAEAAAEPMGAAIAPHADRVLVASFSDARRRRVLAAIAAAGGDTMPATSAGRETITRVVAGVRLRARAVVSRSLRGIDALQVPEQHGRVRIVTPRFIEAAHRLGVEVHVWTVNDPDAMIRLVDLGVDGIVTDRADIALDVLA